MSTFSAIYFDGAVAADRLVTADFGAPALTFSGPGVAPQSWHYGDLTAVNPPAPGIALRIANAAAPGARLVVGDETAKAALLQRAPHLRGGVSWPRLGKLAAGLAAGLLLLFGIAYGVLQVAPQRVAFLLPEAWRDRAGEQIEKSMVEGATLCETPAATTALAPMMARLAEGAGDMPPVRLRIYDMPVMNAFALPGGRMVVTSELLKKAEAPEELAGVVAHELGHVTLRHSEAQLVRATGLQLLLAIATGGNGGDALSSLAGVAAILRYSRAAEAEADDFALRVMTEAAIDPMGFKHFFERVLAEKGRNSDDGLGKIGSVFATHPGTEERIRKITPLPPGVTARPVMSDAQWQALKAVCGG